MGKSLEEISKLQSELLNLWSKYPYFRGIGISQLKVKNVSLRVGESLSDYCFSIGLNEPPQNLKLIDEYKGVRIFYDIVGDIIAD